MRNPNSHEFDYGQVNIHFRAATSVHGATILYS